MRQRLKPNLFFSKVSGLPCPALRMSAYSSFLLGHHPFVIVIVNCNLDLLPLAQQVNINFYPTQVRSLKCSDFGPIKSTTRFCRTATVGSYLPNSKEPASPPTLEIFSTRQTCLTSTRRKTVSRSGCLLQAQFQPQTHKTEAIKYGASHCFLMQ